MLDTDPRLRGAYEKYKAAEAAKEAALARINSRRNKLANMPAPLNTLINVAQLFGYEYEYSPEDMREVDRNTALMHGYQQDVSIELGRTPGEYPLSSLWYHPNAMISSRDDKPQPWVAHFTTQIEGDYFSVDVKTERILARKTKEQPQIQVRTGNIPILSLPERYRMLVCTEPDWRCQDDYVSCRPAEFRITKLAARPKLLVPPSPKSLK